jgi:hypothetical protein
MTTNWSDRDPNAADPGPVNRLDVSRPGEPVAIAEVVRLVFALLAGLGWLLVPSDAVNAVATGVAAVVSIVATVLARRRVTPIAK